MLSESHDAEIVVRCQLGESDAWQELISRWHPRLTRFVHKMIPHRASAEDVLQVAWLRIVRSLVSLRDPAKFSAWSFRIARLAVIDHLRHQYRQPVETKSEFEVEQQNVAPDHLEIHDLIQTGLEQLHASEREVIVLHYLEELSIAEVAEICSVATGTVKSRLHRARKVLRKALLDKEQK